MFSQARLTSKVFEDIETNSRHFKKEFGNKIKMISDHIFIGINYNYIIYCQCFYILQKMFIQIKKCLLENT